MRHHSLLDLHRWMPLGRAVLGFVLAAGVLFMIPAASASLVIMLAPWWLLGVLLVLIGSLLQHLSSTQAPLPTVTSTIDDLTIPLVGHADAPAVTAPVDDLTETESAASHAVSTSVVRHGSTVGGVAVDVTHRCDTRRTISFGWIVSRSPWWYAGRTLIIGYVVGCWSEIPISVKQTGCPPCRCIILAGTQPLGQNVSRWVMRVLRSRRA